MQLHSCAACLRPQGPDSCRNGRKAADIKFVRRDGVALNHVARDDVVTDFGRPIDIDETALDIKPGVILLQVRRHIAPRDLRRNGVTHLSDSRVGLNFCRVIEI